MIDGDFVAHSHHVSPGTAKSQQFQRLPGRQSMTDDRQIELLVPPVGATPHAVFHVGVVEHGEQTQCLLRGDAIGTRKEMTLKPNTIKFVQAKNGPSPNTGDRGVVHTGHHGHNRTPQQGTREGKCGTTQQIVTACVLAIILVPTCVTIRTILQSCSLTLHPCPAQG